MLGGSVLFSAGRGLDTILRVTPILMTRHQREGGMEVWDIGACAVADGGSIQTRR